MCRKGAARYKCCGVAAIPVGFTEIKLIIKLLKVKKYNIWLENNEIKRI